MENKFDKVLHNILKIQSLLMQETINRLPGAVLTRDLGECVLCDGYTSSGMLKVCDSCYDEYFEIYFKEPENNVEKN